MVKTDKVASRSFFFLRMFPLFDVKKLHVPIQNVKMSKYCEEEMLSFDGKCSFSIFIVISN